MGSFWKTLAWEKCHWNWSESQFLRARSASSLFWGPTGTASKGWWLHYQVGRPPLGDCFPMAVVARGWAVSRFEDQGPALGASGLREKVWNHPSVLVIPMGIVLVLEGKTTGCGCPVIQSRFPAQSLLPWAVLLRCLLSTWMMMDSPSPRMWSSTDYGKLKQGISKRWSSYVDRCASFRWDWISGTAVPLQQNPPWTMRMILRVWRSRMGVIQKIMALIIVKIAFQKQAGNLWIRKRRRWLDGFQTIWHHTAIIVIVNFGWLNEDTIAEIVGMYFVLAAATWSCPFLINNSMTQFSSVTPVTNTSKFLVPGNSWANIWRNPLLQPPVEC